MFSSSDSSSNDSNEDKKSIVHFKMDQDMPTESSEVVPMSEWSSLEIMMQEHNKKKLLFEQGLYSPGSGDVCPKFLSQSSTNVCPEFFYKSSADPGIKEAIFEAKMPPATVIKDEQELYLALCKEMDICPVRMFHRGLLTDYINLSYYGVSSVGVRAMARALQTNKSVKKFNLTDNYLDNDACYHLGVMLSKNGAIEELNMAGCHIGPAGLRRLGNWLTLNWGLYELNLARNILGEEGGTLYAEMVMNGVTIERLNLSNNGLGKETTTALGDVFLLKDNITHLDLSMNNLFKCPTATVKMLDSIAFSTVLEKFNLAWNTLHGPRLASALSNLMMIPTLRNLDLSNNKFSGESITIIVNGLVRAKTLTTLNLSSNPLTTIDAQIALEQLLTPLVKLENLLMNNVVVDKSFLVVLDNVKKLKCRKNFVVTYDKVLANRVVKGIKKGTIIKRADNLWSLRKKDKINMAHFFMSLHKEKENIDVEELLDKAAAESISLDDDLLTELVEVFRGPNSENATLISVKSVCMFMPQMFPHRKVPKPTPSQEDIT